MSERYTRLSVLPSNLYREGSPILIVAGALLRDNKTGGVLVQLKLRNLYHSPLTACKVHVRAFDPSGAELQGVAGHSYLDLAVSQGADFGAKVGIVLPDRTTRRVSVYVIQAVFDDSTVWEGPVSEWMPVRPRPLSERFPDPELAKQYAIEVGGDCQYVPEIVGGAPICACGRIGLVSEKVCYHCRRDIETLIAALDDTSLTQKRDERLTREAKERAERERIAEERRKEQERKEAEERAERERRAEEQRVAAEAAKKKAKKIGAIAAGSVAVVVLAAILIAQVIIPAVKYRAAEALLKERDYEGAVAAFAALGDYRDSSERIADVPYVIAEDLLADRDYDAALQAFQDLGDYRDAPDRVNEVLQLKYEEAESCLLSGDFDGAIDRFTLLGDFSDAPERFVEAKYLKALDFLKAGDYEDAVTDFKSLGDYKDSPQRLNEAYEGVKETNYQKAKEALQAQDRETAQRLLTQLGDYKDSIEILNREIKDPIFQSAMTLFESGDYVDAYQSFRSLDGYNGSTDQMAKIYDTVTADAFDALNKGDYTSAYKKFTSIQETYPEIIADRTSEINDYTTYCDVKRINFNDNEPHKLSFIYEEIMSINDESLKNDLMDIPQMRTLLTLEGIWSGTSFRFAIKDGNYSYGTVYDKDLSFGLIYFNGRYCTSVSYPDTNRYNEIYNISQNQFSYREHINDLYMNNDKLTRIS